MGPRLAASERLKTRPVKNKANSGSEVELGDIVSRAWSKVGKEIGHTRTMETVNMASCRAELELGIITVGP